MQAYKIKALFVSITPAKNVVVSFDHKSSDANIKSAAATIVSALAPGIDGASFTKNLSWSKFAILGVPCQKPKADSMDIDLELGNLYSTTDLESAL